MMMNDKESCNSDLARMTWQNLILNMNCISDKVLAQYLIEQLDLFKRCLYREAYVAGWDDGISRTRLQ